MRLAIATTGRSTHLPGRYTDSDGRRHATRRTRCGVVMGDGWYVVEATESPTCQKCRALDAYDNDDVEMYAERKEAA